MVTARASPGGAGGAADGNHAPMPLELIVPSSTGMPEASAASAIDEFGYTTDGKQSAAEEKADRGEEGGAGTNAGGVGRRGAGMAALTVAAGLVAAVAAAPVPSARAAAAATLDAVVELTPDNFAAEVEGPAAGRVFVEFYAPW